MKFKEGDKVKVKKLSEKEFEKIYWNNYNLDYKGYILNYKDYFNQVGLVIYTEPNYCYIEFNNITRAYKAIFYYKELEVIERKEK